jgi:hypothetical protein
LADSLDSTDGPASPEVARNATSTAWKRTDGKTSTSPSGFRELRTPIRPVSTTAISTQFPLGLLARDLRHRGWPPELALRSVRMLVPPFGHLGAVTPTGPDQQPDQEISGEKDHSVDPL